MQFAEIKTTPNVTWIITERDKIQKIQTDHDRVKENVRFIKISVTNTIQPDKTIHSQIVFYTEVYSKCILSNYVKSIWISLQ